MSTGYELTGRTKQKQRTRDALIDAARELLAEGVTPTVEQAADRAGISRTTSYRYFANQRTLVFAAYPQLEAPTLLEDTSTEDPIARLEATLDHYTSQLLEYEPELRAQLRLSLDAGREAADLPLRRGRAIGWFEDALAPLRDRLSADDIHRLALAIRTACGVEALVWLTDVGHLSRDDAVDLMRSSARTLAEAALAPLPRD